MSRFNCSTLSWRYIWYVLYTAAFLLALPSSDLVFIVRINFILTASTCSCKKSSSASTHNPVAPTSLAISAISIVKRSHKLSLKLAPNAESFIACISFGNSRSVCVAIFFVCSAFLSFSECSNAAIRSDCKPCSRCASTVALSSKFKDANLNNALLVIP